MILRKASIASIRCVVTWTKIKTVPIKIIIDEMQLKLEVTGSPAEKDFVELNPEDYGYTDGPVKAEKYGFIDGVRPHRHRLWTISHGFHQTYSTGYPHAPWDVLFLETMLFGC